MISRKPGVDARDRAARVWGTTPAGSVFGGGAPVGSREFFENVLRRRSSYEQPWLFDLVHFASFKEREVLELGCGAGYDAYAISYAGGRYWGIDVALENARRTRQHLAHYGYTPRVIQADAEQLPFREERFDVVFTNGVLHHIPNDQATLREVWRVLKPGGEFWAIVYHRDSVFYWITLGFIDQILQCGFLRRSMAERLSMIEHSTSDDRPFVRVYSRRGFEILLRRWGFGVDGMWVRKLVHEDLPNLPVLGRIWRRIPVSWLELLGKQAGWYLIASARKPAR